MVIINLFFIFFFFEEVDLIHIKNIIKRVIKIIKEEIHNKILKQIRKLLINNNNNNNNNRNNNIYNNNNNNNNIYNNNLEEMSLDLFPIIIEEYN
jgi:hypothetical protein